MQCANGEGNGDALALELVPDVGADGVVDLVDSGMIAHVELDLVDHGVIGEIDQENSYRRLSQNFSAAAQPARGHPSRDWVDFYTRLRRESASHGPPLDNGD